MWHTVTYCDFCERHDPEFRQNLDSAWGNGHKMYHHGQASAYRWARWPRRRWDSAAGPSSVTSSSFQTYFKTYFQNLSKRIPNVFQFSKFGTNSPRTEFLAMISRWGDKAPIYARLWSCSSARASSGGSSDLCSMMWLLSDLSKARIRDTSWPAPEYMTR